MQPFLYFLKTYYTQSHVCFFELFHKKYTFFENNQEKTFNKKFLVLSSFPRIFQSKSCVVFFGGPEWTLLQRILKCVFLKNFHEKYTFCENNQ
jgi:hypothetical protein